MKILLVIDGMHPRDGGPPAVVAGSAIALRALGHDVTVLTTVTPGDRTEVERTWSEMLSSEVRLSFLNTSPLLPIRSPARFRISLEDHVTYADVVHIHGVWSPFLWCAGLTAHAMGKPYFVSVHGLLDYRAVRSSWIKWTKKYVAIKFFSLNRFMSRASGVIFGSASESLQSWLFARGMRIEILPNGVSPITGTVPPHADSLALLEQIAPSFPQWRRSLLFFSRVHPKKGLDMLVAAFQQVAPDFPGAGLLIAGLKQDAEYQRTVEVMISASGVSDRIIFTTELTGPASQFLYQACDAFILPSHTEGFSMAIVEALACGRPVLITRSCHVPEVSAYGAGLIAEPNVGSLAVHLRALLSLSEGEMSVMGRQARALFLDKFTLEKVAVRLEHLYSAAMERIN
jgi:glycosyltransferase involved in cell wall biosynthesis